MNKLSKTEQTIKPIPSQWISIDTYKEQTKTFSCMLLVSYMDNKNKCKYFWWKEWY